MKTLLRATSAMPLAVLALAAFSAPAYAQSAAPAAADTTEDAAPGEIVVTAQKRSESLQRVPLAVSVLSGETLAQSSRPSIESAAQMVPSLNFLKSGTTLNQTIFLRGVGTATFSIAGEPSVSTVVDGVVYARSGEAFSDLVDIKQMEVLRGPQGTLFGKNASAGVINITTLMPEHKLGGSVEASYFDHNEYRVKGAINLPLGDDLAARMTAFYGDYDGNIRNLTTNQWVNGYKHWGLRGQLLYDPGNNLKLYFAADYHKNNDDCCADIIATGTASLTGTSVTYATTSPVFAALPTPRFANTRQVRQNLVTSTKEQGWGMSMQADVSLGENTLTSITAYRKYDNTEIRDGDFLDRAYTSTNGTTTTNFGQLHDSGPQKSNTFTQELRLTSPGNQPLSWVIGGYFSRAKSERIFTRRDEVCAPIVGAPTNVLIPCGSANALPSTFPTATADFGSTFKNFALFGQATARATDTFRVIMGVRYSHDELSVFHSRNTKLSGPGIQPSFPVTGTGTGAPATVYTASTKEDNVSGKVAMQADLSRNVIAYVSYARGYKGPAYNVFFNLTATGTNVIEAETSDAFELGLKNTLLGGKLTLNIAGFFARYHNFQANNPDLVANVPVTRFTNAGEVSTRGVELDMNYRPARDFTISGGVAYTDAHVNKFKAAPGATAIVPSGTPLGFAPKWKGSLAMDYRVRTGGFADVSLGGQMSFQSSQLELFSDVALKRLVGTQPGYALVNLQIGLVDPDDKWKLTFQVRNVFDQSYAAAIPDTGPSGSYRYQIPRDVDRYFGVTARVNF